MPRKKSTKKDKGAQTANDQNTSNSLQEDLPQVWLAVQPGKLDVQLEEMGSKREIKSRKKVVIQEVAHNPKDASLIMEPNEPAGWEDQEELDYSKVKKKEPLPILPVIERHSTPVEVENWQQRKYSGISSETPSLFNYAHSSSYHVKYIGEVQSVSSSWVDEDKPQSILKVIEMAQHHGDIPWKASQGGQRILIVSKYGIKITDEKKQRVFGRYSLHNIINVVHYTTVHMTPTLVLRTLKEDSTSTDTFDMYLYECQDEDQATDVCVTLGQAFEAVMNKMKMEENLHGPLIQ